MSSNSTISPEDAAKTLATARQACFFTGAGDIAEQLCKANMPYGIAKLRHVQQALGIPPDACFVGAPDATITRNIPRWNAGFGYGGRVRYTGDFGMLDLRSNCCGIYLGVVGELPEPEVLLRRVEELRAGNQLTEATGTTWDFGASNHFISIVKLDSEVEGRGFAVLCHGSGPELRGEGPHGMGLYHDRSPTLQQLAVAMDTPWGTAHIVSGEGAARFRQSFVRAEKQARMRRAIVAQKLFRDIEELSNTTHQGASAINDYHLGCVVDTGTLVVPVALRADLPHYLVQMEPNLSAGVMESLGFSQRAAELGVTDWLTHANLLPHGGGYAVPGFRRIRQVMERGPARLFEMEVDSPYGTSTYHTDFRSAPFAYRGEEVVERLQRLGMGRVVAKGLPVYQFVL